MKNTKTKTKIGYVIMAHSNEDGTDYPVPRQRTFDVLPDGKELTDKQLKARENFWNEFNFYNGESCMECIETDRSEIFKTKEEAEIALKEASTPEFDEKLKIKPVFI